MRVWRDRFKEQRLPGLWSRHRGRAPSQGIEKLEARIIDWTLHRKPTDGSTHWSSRKLGSALGIDHMRVARVSAKAGLQPHRRRHYMVSDDPQFEKKAAEIIGLYLKPPAHAAVFCVDEKSAIQALDRLDPVLPLSPGRAERHGFEYFRHGTLSLYAALNTATGEVLGKTANPHTSAEFVKFLREVVATQPANTQIHIIADNLSTHKTKAVQDRRVLASQGRCAFIALSKTSNSTVAKLVATSLMAYGITTTSSWIIPPHEYTTFGT